ncbi:hypothetical protein [Nonomuraea cavernae]|uniref:Uncharacterized protein n=1 Tax=Nonomuraea cavernae TaxID=2045107 RepID=A0A918DGG2_9ACTN|nr:hypothetical protein [Nonomuraea cavernae]MCA2184665.1 hypothetical protein [Nonomuraea cavernae]GGO63128.1 hypothetical protein GCM10012289_09330 [Nonomuraea cavernae]
MYRTTTPTNELITEAAEVYVLLLTNLFIPVGCLVAATQNPKRVAVTFDLGHRFAVQDALVFWHEAIAAPLAEAHSAALALEDVSKARMRSKAGPNSLDAMVARRDVKRLRVIIAESDATIRRELVKLQEQLTRNL